MWSCQEGKMEAVKYLVSIGCDPHQRSDVSGSPVFLCNSLRALTCLCVYRLGFAVGHDVCYDGVLRWPPRSTTVPVRHVCCGSLGWRHGQAVYALQKYVVRCVAIDAPSPSSSENAVDAADVRRSVWEVACDAVARRQTRCTAWRI